VDFNSVKNEIKRREKEKEKKRTEKEKIRKKGGRRDLNLK
jgi:hypothetical protein